MLASSKVLGLCIMSIVLNSDEMLCTKTVIIAVNSACVIRAIFVACVILLSACVFIVMRESMDLSFSIKSRAVSFQFLYIKFNCCIRTFRSVLSPNLILKAVFFYLWPCFKIWPTENKITCLIY